MGSSGKRSLAVPWHVALFASLARTKARTGKPPRKRSGTRLTWGSLCLVAGAASAILEVVYTGRVGQAIVDVLVRLPAVVSIPVVICGDISVGWATCEAVEHAFDSFGWLRYRDDDDDAAEDDDDGEAVA